MDTSSSEGSRTMRIHEAPRRTHRDERLGRRDDEGLPSSSRTSPVLVLWPRLSKDLRDALYGVSVQHGIVSTRKAVAAIGSVDGTVRSFLSNLDEIAPGAEAVPRSQYSSPRTAPPLESMPSSFPCSSCVDAAAQSFLSEGGGREGGSSGPTSSVIDAKAFFVRLVRVSTGEFMHWWRKAGLTDDVVSAHLLRLSTALVDASSESHGQDDSAEVEAEYVNVTMD